MIAIYSSLPSSPPQHPPIILVHGAANSAVCWTFWQRELAARGWESHAIDLRGHGRSVPYDLSHTNMQHYASDVSLLLAQLARPTALLGWSMGGLVAMMTAAQGEVIACVALGPSMPSREMDSAAQMRTGEFGPEEYHLDSRNPRHQPAMADLDLEERKTALASLGRESPLARDERRAGVVIEALPCPLLIVTGSRDREWPRERYDNLWLKADYLSAEGASHWGLVLNRRILAQLVPKILSWLSTHC